ncbi:MAG: NAD(P)/FAD-dependent oxidoreductase [Chitinophagaceae bacterium]
MAKSLIVIGGGAAGFFCAVNAARINPNLHVTILEKSNKLLSKVKVSGGGRCNVTHHCFDIDEMSRRYPRGQHFVKKSFHRFFTTDTINWFEQRGVKLKAEKDGRMFPVTDSSQSIINCLQHEAQQYNVKVKTQTEIKSIKFQNEKFVVALASSELLIADYVCIATGGYPKAPMFGWIKDLGHLIEEPVPSLFTFNLPTGQVGLPAHSITKLMGVSVDKAIVKIIGSKLIEEGPLLITHWGLSGPVVLRLSAWGARELAACSWQFAISINWLPDYNENNLRERFSELRKELASQKVFNRNPFGLPQRLWEFLLTESSISIECRWSDLPAKEQNRMIRNLCQYECAVKGKTTFKEEFVTAGGVKLNEIDANTMMSKKIPGLFFAGEVMDVDGITGGFNFQHAWTSGFIAGSTIAVESSGILA